MSKVAALAEAKEWLRNLTTEKIEFEVAALERGAKRKLATSVAAGAQRKVDPRTERPFSHPYFWAAFVLVGDAD
jgi:CHAT domain-containing protein